jgi:hypothetical protein
VLASASSIQSAIHKRIRASKTPRVWTADDFADLGSRSAVDLALHRLASIGDVRRAGSPAAYMTFPAPTPLPEGRPLPIRATLSPR